MPRASTDTIAELRAPIYDLVRQYVRSYRQCRYADVRVEIGEGKVASVENGMDKQSSEDYGFAFGVRVIAGDKATAPGYFGQTLGSADLPNLPKVLRAGLDHAYHRAIANAQRKSASRERFGPLGDALTDAALTPIDVQEATVSAHYQRDPREVPLQEVMDYVREVSRTASAVADGVVYNYVYGGTMLNRQLFCSSEGANIDQTSALSEGMAYIVAQGNEGVQELYDFIGHQRGWEVVTGGVDEDYFQLPNLMTFSTSLARDTVDLSNARACPMTDKEVVVVTDPHYNALVAHEVVGHPTELDRAMKYETGYAGRSWLFRDIEETQIGKQIGSPLVSAYSDPTMNGFGYYQYDDEGTPARRTPLIENGVFQGFMNSRQTAAIVNAPPNGHYKATDASLVPLIRMSNTFLSGGESDPQRIIRDVEHGYYVVGHRIPSIAESRENFRITAMKVYEIRNGEIGELYRNGGIMSDTRDYFMSIDAVGSDFRLFSIPNCGKGQPMQTKRMGNGGPTMRGRARLSGAS